MLFSSVSFLFFFLPALLAVYYLIPRKHREIRNLALVLFSLFFYGYGGPRFILLMLVSITINYVCGLFAGPEHKPAVRKTALLAAVVLGLGLLGWFKYSGFFAGILNSLGTNLPLPDVTLPLGISFYTFQGLSYIVDVYRGDAQAQKNPLKVALYISLFSQLIAGPIICYNDVERELSARRENLEVFGDGAVRFVFGLAKKMLLANALGEIADRLFSGAGGPLSVLGAWVGALSYTGQIYFDFSGYSDMALGLGKMFGFHFLENFNYPYISKSVTEFWRRWHISLSGWFRNYLYIPLGGNRVSKLKLVRNIVIVWMLTGLWHGAAWTFVVWGAWFCALLLGEKFVWGRLLERAPRAVRHIYAMLLVVISWVIFRADTLPAAARFIGEMFGSSGRLWDGRGVYYILEYWPELLFGVIAALPVKNAVQGFLERRPGAASSAVAIWGPRALALALLATSYLKLVTGSFNPFIYFRF